MPDEQSITPVELIAYSWLSPMDRYVKLHDMGVQMLAINYDAWLEAPRETAVAMLDYCAMLPPDLTAVYEALQRDSQSGSVLSQNAVKDHHALRNYADPVELDRVLASQAVIKTAAFIPPNTLKNQ